MRSKTLRLPILITKIKRKTKEGFDKIAKIIYDDITSKGLDGVDFDHEPNYCGCNTWQITKTGRISVFS